MYNVYAKFYGFGVDEKQYEIVIFSELRPTFDLSTILWTYL